jgi:hypothetical protein
VGEGSGAGKPQLDEILVEQVLVLSIVVGVEVYEG